MLERTNTRLEANLQQALEQAEVHKRKIDRLEAECEIKDEQLQAKNLIIEQFKKASENSDQAKKLDDDEDFEEEEVPELQSKIELLESQTIQFSRKMTEAAKGNLDTMLPLIDELRQRTTTSTSDLEDCRAELSNAKSELSDTKAELVSSKTEAKMIRGAYGFMLNSVMNLADDDETTTGKLKSAARVMQGGATPFAEFNETCAQLRRDFEASIKYLESRRPGNGLQSTGRPSTLPLLSNESAKEPHSPAGVELVRLKDRRTLHRLNPS